MSEVAPAEILCGNGAVNIPTNGIRLDHTASPSKSVIPPTVKDITAVVSGTSSAVTVAATGTLNTPSVNVNSHSNGQTVITGEIFQGKLNSPPSDNTLEDTSTSPSAGAIPSDQSKDTPEVKLSSSFKPSVSPDHGSKSLPTPPAARSTGDQKQTSVVVTSAAVFSSNPSRPAAGPSALVTASSESQLKTAESVTGKTPVSTSYLPGSSSNGTSPDKSIGSAETLPPISKSASGAASPADRADKPSVSTPSESVGAAPVSVPAKTDPVLTPATCDGKAVKQPPAASTHTQPLQPNDILVTADKKAAASGSCATGAAVGEDEPMEEAGSEKKTALSAGADSKAVEGSARGEKRARGDMESDSSPEKSLKKRRLPIAEKTPRQPQRRKQALESQERDEAARRPQRSRAPTQPYQSPVAAFEAIPRALRPAASKPTDSKLVVFFKNEYLAVRNVENSFFVCQAMQNVHKDTKKVKVRWMTAQGSVYTPDFYDTIDFESILTTLAVRRAGGGGRQELCENEADRTQHILQRALDTEAGRVSSDADAAGSSSAVEDHPDGLDISLYTDESQLEKNDKSKPVKSPTSTKPKRATTQTIRKSVKQSTATPSVLAKKSTGKLKTVAKKAGGKSSPTRKARTVASEKASKQKALAQAFARGRRGAAGRQPAEASSAVASPSSSSAGTAGTRRHSVQTTRSRISARRK